MLLELNIFILHWLDSRFCIYRNNLWLKGWSVERGKGGIGIESMFRGYARWFKLDAIPTQITSKTTIYKNKPLIEANKLFTCVASKGTNLFRKKAHALSIFVSLDCLAPVLYVINPLCEVDKTSLGVQFSVLIHQTVAQLAPIHVFLPYCLLSHLISEIKGDISQLIPRPKNFITSNSILF